MNIFFFFLKKKREREKERKFFTWEIALEKFSSIAPYKPETSIFLLP